MRFIIYGAGAMGGIIAARLIRHGHDVIIVARGATARAIRDDGLRFTSAVENLYLKVPVVQHPREIAFTDEDVAILAMKTQDTLPALDALTAAAPTSLPIICAQNGVENERNALRRFDQVYGMYLYIYGSSPRPGAVECFTSKPHGVADIGRYPHGADDRAAVIASILSDAGFAAQAQPDIMRWKYAKLVDNLGNAFDAVSGGTDAAPVAPLYAAARTEAYACYAAAGIDAVPEVQAADRYQFLLPLDLVNGAAFPGGSTRQSMLRGATETEVDYLTGEIVLLGRLHGVPTPVNSALLAIVKTMAAERMPPASMKPEELWERVGRMAL